MREGSEFEAVEEEIAEYQDDVAGRVVETPVSLLSGKAGTGKTYSLLKRAAEPGSKMLLTSTTGISAINLGAATLNSTLGYFDTASLRDRYLSGGLARKLHQIALDYRTLAVEEVSMMEADQLDVVYRAVDEANRYSDVKIPLELLLCGDFAQLPPVKGRWAFEADCWGKFAANTTRLTKVWRQGDGAFLDALNLTREGKGGVAAELLTNAGMEWHGSRAQGFDGTTILATNKEVNAHNNIELMKLREPMQTVPSRRWGKQRGEWGENRKSHEWGIPVALELKVGALVMILSNDFAAGFVNGDCGKVEEVNAVSVRVRLLRNDQSVMIYKVVRAVEQSDEPDGFSGKKFGRNDDPGWLAEPHFRARRYVLGQIEFLPLRLAWATTIHKSQSLTLDRVQFDFRDRFAGSPSMVYVAMSRCRTLEGLRLVGGKDVFAQRCQMDPRVVAWL